MKAIAILGSRNENGMTAQSVDALLKGLDAEDSQIEKAFLPKKSIQRCQQCDDAGWGICRSQGECVIEDDFAHLVNGIRNADLVILATPVYFSELSESLRTFLDRLRRICMHEDGKQGVNGKPVIGICVAGGGGGGAPQCASSMEKVLRTCGFDIVDMVPVRRQNIDLKKQVLETTGKWLATR